MEFRLCSLVLFVSCMTCRLLIQAQDQSGFVSLACGAPKGESFIDTVTGLNYTSDADFVETGKALDIKESKKLSSPKKYWHARSFPTGDRNCYTFKVSKSGKYLIKFYLLWSNFYIGLFQGPVSFNVYVGANLWTTFINHEWAECELLHIMKSDTCFICLVKTGSTTPLVSALELRPADTLPYKYHNGSLNCRRRNVGLSKYMRFNDDPLDRDWFGYQLPNWSKISTTETVTTNNGYRLPQGVMQTAAIPVNVDEAMIIANLSYAGNTKQFDVYLHVAEIQKLDSNETRQIEVLCNDKLIYGPFSPVYLNTTTIYFNTSSMVSSDIGIYTILLRKSRKSTLPPLLNAFEIYDLLSFTESETNGTEVTAMFDMKKAYNVVRDSWQGDPCAPTDYMWEGLNCSFNGYVSPTIISLNLSSNGLRGEIAHSISHLSKLETLDLSNNELEGSIPEFLAEMPKLKLINLTGNNFSGSIPNSLLWKVKQGSLSLSADAFDESPSTKEHRKRKSHNLIVMVITILIGLLVGALIATFFIFKCRTRRAPNNGPHKTMVGTKDERFTYSNILIMTNNFEKIIGRGAFGVVYHGVIEGRDVAVKLITHSSMYAYRQFQAEVELLVRVHHKNLTSLLGYCEEEDNFVLVYEYMENGDLKKHLSGDRGSCLLIWKERLQIAIDVAQGLEYLHNGCRPPIIHRDVKTSNILLNKDFRAKLSDFGLSRSFNTDSETHISTIVAGTPGYLDPEYYTTHWLTEKSDVYSFGIVLLELITNRPIISRTREVPLLSEWVARMLNGGDIISIIDPKLQEDFDASSVWRVVEIAMSCSNPLPNRRPTMTEVISELNDGMKLETLKNEADIMGMCTTSSLDMGPMPQ